MDRLSRARASRIRTPVTWSEVENCLKKKRAELLRFRSDQTLARVEKQGDLFGVMAFSDRILGFTAFAPEAGEVMTIVQIAMNAGLPYMTLRDTILTHPTMAEGLSALFRAVPARL